VRGKRERDTTADTGAATGDEGNLPFQ